MELEHRIADVLDQYRYHEYRRRQWWFLLNPFYTIDPSCAVNLTRSYYKWLDEMQARDGNERVRRFAIGDCVVGYINYDIPVTKDKAKRDLRLKRINVIGIPNRVKESILDTVRDLNTAVSPAGFKKLHCERLTEIFQCVMEAIGSDSSWRHVIEAAIPIKQRHESKKYTMYEGFVGGERSVCRRCEVEIRIVKP